MSTTTVPHSVASIALRAVPFLFAVPVIAGFAGAVMMGCVADQFTDAVLERSVMTYFYVGLAAGVGAYLATLLDIYHKGRVRIWTSIFLGTAVAEIYVMHAHKLLGKNGHILVLATAFVAVLVMAPVVRLLTR